MYRGTYGASHDTIPAIRVGSEGNPYQSHVLEFVANSRDNLKRHEASCSFPI
jgi:hypothetical protein